MSDFIKECPMDPMSKESQDLKESEKLKKKNKKLKKENKKLKKQVSSKSKKLNKAERKLKTKDLIYELERGCQQIKMENQIIKLAFRHMMQASGESKGLPDFIVDMGGEVEDDRSR